MDSKNAREPGNDTGTSGHIPARDTATTILSMPVVRYPAAVAAVLVAADCVVAFVDGRWLGLAVNAPVALFLAALASGALSRFVDSGRTAPEGEATPPPERGPEPPPMPDAGWAIQARKIERDKALFAVSAVLRKRGERHGSSHEIWTTEIGEFEAYLAQRLGELGKATPPDLHAKVLIADRDASTHGEYGEGLAQHFARILEG